MKLQRITAIAAVGTTMILAAVLVAAQDRFTLQSPSGIAFSEFKGYEGWQMIAPSDPDNAGGCGTAPPPGCIKAILGNPAMIKAFSEGVPANGKPVPDGAVMAKIEWAKKRLTGPPYAATVPGALSEVSFMVKDSKRFPKTDGWGYATFRYEANTDAWKAFGENAAFANTCHACHTIVKSNDFVFTDYPKR